MSRSQSFFALAALFWLVTAPVPGQVAESATDPTGVSIPYSLVHLVHSEDPQAAGTTADLMTHDPFLFYQLGRDLVGRQFQLVHGVYGRAGELSVPLYVDQEPGLHHGTAARIARDHASSCGFCHSIPYREPGSGQTIALGSATGRNTTHFFGGGLIEMLAEQTRQKIYERYDENRNGRIDRAEVAESRPVLIAPRPGAPEIDFGDLAPGEDGVPQLNPVFRVWYLDRRGVVVPDALSLDDEDVAAFDFVLQPFGWGRGQRLHGGRRLAEGGESSTLRGFYATAADLHMGLQAHDPTQLAGPDGRAERSLPGAQQYPLPSGVLDLGRERSASGISLDDPDGDGHFHELSEGDLDAAEFYMLHAPAPAVRPRGNSEQGREVLAAAGCLRCHVESWRIEARDEERGLLGDRRLFSLEPRVRDPDETGDPGAANELVATLVPLWKRSEDGAYRPRHGAYEVERIYSDLRHWDLGPAFYERRYDGSAQRFHRTAPLWGVGSTAPYGHDGRYSTLDGVIRAHGGAAMAERDAYVALSDAERQLLISYLESLVLYTTDEIPSDIDGDGEIAESYEVAGQKVGYERFDARFLFARPPRYRHLRDTVTPYGYEKPLMLIENVAETYSLDRAARRDSDGDGFPDVVDPQPEQAGVSAPDHPKTSALQPDRDPR